MYVLLPHSWTDQTFSSKRSPIGAHRALQDRSYAWQCRPGGVGKRYEADILRWGDRPTRPAVGRMGIPQGPGHLLPGCSGVELGEAVVKRPVSAGPGNALYRPEWCRERGRCRRFQVAFRSPYVKQVIYRMFRSVFLGQPHDLIALPVIGMATYSVACDLTNWTVAMNPFTFQAATRPQTRPAESSAPDALF